MKSYPAVIQARNGSSRLPGKAMIRVLGRPMISFLIERASASLAVSRVIVATTEDREDDELYSYCREQGIEVFRGSRDDVLGRIFHCVKDFPDEHFIKLWGDSPLIDPAILQDLALALEVSYRGFDYVSNNHPSTYPEGMQAEIISKKALSRVVGASDLNAADREHVTTYLWQRPDQFRLGNVELARNLQPQYRICLDYPEDLLQIEKIITALYSSDPLFGMKAMISFLDNHQEIKEINKSYYEDSTSYYQRLGLAETKQ